MNVTLNLCIISSEIPNVLIIYTNLDVGRNGTYGAVMLALVKRFVIVTVSVVFVAFRVLIVANALSQQKPSSGRHCIATVSSPSISQSYS